MPIAVNCSARYEIVLMTEILRLKTLATITHYLNDSEISRLETVMRQERDQPTRDLRQTEDGHEAEPLPPSRYGRLRKPNGRHDR